MTTWNLIKTANRNLFRNKLRTFLTVVAIFIGAFTLTMTNGIGDGMRDYVESQVKNVEGDRVVIVRKKTERPAGPRSGIAEPRSEQAQFDQHYLESRIVAERNQQRINLEQDQAAGLKAPAASTRRSRPPA